MGCRLKSVYVLLVWKPLSVPPVPPLKKSNWYVTGGLASEADVAVMEMLVVLVSPGKVEKVMGLGVGGVVSGAGLTMIVPVMPP